jgi:hypothetical protein
MSARQKKSGTAKVPYCTVQCCGSDLFDGDPDMDPTFKIDVDPDPAPNFTHVGKSIFFKLCFFHSSASLHYFIFSSASFQHLDSVLKFSGKVVQLCFTFG